MNAPSLYAKVIHLLHDQQYSSSLVREIDTISRPLSHSYHLSSSRQQVRAVKGNTMKRVMNISSAQVMKKKLRQLKNIGKGKGTTPVIETSGCTLLKRRADARRAGQMRRAIMLARRQSVKFDGPKKRIESGPATSKKKTENALEECIFCGAVVWEQEKKGTRGRNKTPVFSVCCQQGRVKLPPEPHPPEYLKTLLATSPHFQQNIRTYNSILAFTSMGAQIDSKVMHKVGPFTFRIHGHNSHKIGSLLPLSGQPPKFNQLYIFDTANEIRNRISAVRRRTYVFHVLRGDNFTTTNRPFHVVGVTQLAGKEIKVDATNKYDALEYEDLPGNSASPNMQKVTLERRGVRVTET